jgi:diaminopimelate decarboxylase
MFFAYRNGTLCAENVPLEDVARRFGTPCYVYSRAAISGAYGEFMQALQGRDALVCYSVKANPSLAIVALLARLGAGFDIVSGGELSRVLAAGGDPAKVLFSGVGKTEEEIAFALEKTIYCLNVESEPELDRIAGVARRMGRRAPIAFRVNPDIDAKTHPYISTGLRENKFGVPHAEAERLYARAASLADIEILGIGCHIGSQLTEPGPFAAAMERLGALARRIEARGIALRHLDMGGGMGIRYKDEAVRPVGEFVSEACRALRDDRHKLILDPGRSIVGNAGVLLTKVEYVKAGNEHRFVIVDAGMNDLLRPALYGAWHDVRTVHETRSTASGPLYDIVGPVCESADFLAKARALEVSEGDLLAVMSAGAYGMSMSSNYNSRPRAAEVMVGGEDAHLVRRRERAEELFALESIPA